MKTFAINTLGCKVNQYESQQIRELLENMALMRVQLNEKPDLVVINTCCVTHSASAKSRQFIRKAKKHNPDATVIIAGCLGVANGNELKNIPAHNDSNIHIVRQKNNLPAFLSEIVNSGRKSQTTSCYNKTLIAPKIKNKNNLSKKHFENTQLSCKPKFTLLTSYPGKSRAFLKIQDGCDGYCTYCIVPKVRPKIHNKPINAVIKEAYNLMYAGHKEIVLTGICLGAYGQSTVRRKKWDHDKKDSLAKLLDKIAQIPELKRVRLSSLGPGDVTEKLIDTYCKHANIMPHLHMSLQSGSDNILRKMARQYRVKEFLSTIEKLKSKLDRPAITTDIIVGFPGETDEDFEETIKIAKQVGFAKIHVFSYSLRQGTAAAKMGTFVSSEVIKERSKRLRNLDNYLQQKFRKQFAGEKVEVIVEGSCESGKLKGRCQRYFMVDIPQAKNTKTGDIVTLTL